MKREEWKLFYRTARARTQTPSLNYKNTCNAELHYILHNGKKYCLKTLRTAYRTESEISAALIHERPVKQRLAVEFAWLAYYTGRPSPVMPGRARCVKKAAAKATLETIREIRLTA